jgi:hypothetical protein
MTGFPDSVSQDSETARRALLSLVTEGWRFSRVFARMINRLDAGEQSRYVSQFRYFAKKLEDSLLSIGCKLVDLEGHPFDPGMAATVLNLDEFTSEDKLVVDQMLEPVIMGEQGPLTHEAVQAIYKNMKGRLSATRKPLRVG